jgi:3-dehydrosphinganine reductase
MFRDQRIVITGGSSGLGLELARMLVGESARVTLIARDAGKLDQAAAELRKRHTSARVTVESVDVCDEEATNAAMQRIAQASGGIDMLVNSAGILREGRFEQLPMKAFRDVMEINYFGILHATRAALPHLRASRGRLVNIASMGGLTGVFGYTPYCSAKHALVGLTESLRYELKPMGIRVHLVCPGEFDSPMVDELDRTRTPENRAHVLTIPKATVTRIAAGTLAGIRAGQFMIVPGVQTRVAAFGVRHFPALTRALGDHAVAKARKQT